MTACWRRYVDVSYNALDGDIDGSLCAWLASMPPAASCGDWVIPASGCPSLLMASNRLSGMRADAPVPRVAFSLACSLINLLLMFDTHGVCLLSHGFAYCRTGLPIFARVCLFSQGCAYFRTGLLICAFLFRLYPGVPWSRRAPEGARVVG